MTAVAQVAPERLERLQEEIKSGNYRPPPVKRVWIPKLGSKELRPLGVPTVGVYCGSDPALTGLYGAARARNVGAAGRPPAVADVLQTLA